MTAHSPVRPISPYSGQCIEVTQYQPPWQALNDFAMNSNFDSDHMDTNNPEYKRLFHQVFSFWPSFDFAISNKNCVLSPSLSIACHLNRCTALRLIHVHIWWITIISIARMRATISTNATIRTVLTRWPRSWKVTRAAKRNSIQVKPEDEIDKLENYRRLNSNLKYLFTQKYVHKNSAITLQHKAIISF